MNVLTTSPYLLYFINNVVVMCRGHSPKIQIQVVVRLFKVYKVSQSDVVMQVRYARASYGLSSSSSAMFRPGPSLRQASGCPASNQEAKVYQVPSFLRLIFTFL